MQKIGILVDTTCDLDLSLKDSRNIKFVPLQIIFNDMRVFRDKIDIDYTQTMDGIINYEAKTSLPLGEDVMSVFDEFVSEGYTHIITLTISQILSGTYNLIRNISENYKDKLCIEHIDTKSTTLGIGHYATEALDMIERKETFENIVKYLNENISNHKIFFGVETLKYLIRGGRLNKFSGTIGEALDIKPILSLDKDGSIETLEKVRGRKKSIAKIIDLAIDFGNIEKIYVAHSDREEEAIYIKEKLEKELNVPIEIKFLGTLLSVHVGPGLIGVIAIKK